MTSHTRSYVVLLASALGCAEPGPEPAKALGESSTEQALSTQIGSINVAHASNGGVASASSGTGALLLGINDGNRRRYVWGDDGPAFPDWVRVTFSGSQTIDEIDVVSVADDVSAANNWTSATEPTLSTTFALYGLTNFTMQYCPTGTTCIDGNPGTGWITAGTVTSNNLVWRKLTFAPVRATAIRTFITGARDGRSRIAELEAWTVGRTPAVGGPFGGRATYRCSPVSTAYCVSPSAPAVTTAEISTFMNNAAINWGCSVAYQSCGPTTDSSCRWYMKTTAPANTYACNVIWNASKQAAYVMLNDANLANVAKTNVGIFQKWEAGLGVIGEMTSNPVPASWTGTSYQLFSNGTITHHASYGAKAVGGANATDKLLDEAWRARFDARPDSANSPVAYPLMQDASCTAGTVGSENCGTIANSDAGRSGRFTKFRDLYANQTGWILARDGWSKALVVEGIDAPAFVSAAGSYPLQPWSVALGFPVENVKQVGLTSGGYPIAVQQFENGFIRRQPNNCANGALTPTAVLGTQSPITTANTNAGFCPSSTIGPVCKQSDQLPIAFWNSQAHGSYTYRCGAGPDNWANGIRLDIYELVSGVTEHRIVDVTEPLLTRWRTEASGVIHPIAWAIKNYKKLPLTAAITVGPHISQSFRGGNVSNVGACTSCTWGTAAGAQCFQGVAETTCGPASNTRSNAPVTLDISLMSSKRRVLHAADAGLDESYCANADQETLPCTPAVATDGLLLEEDGDRSTIVPYANNFPTIDFVYTKARDIDGPHRTINGPLRWAFLEGEVGAYTFRTTEIGYVLLTNVRGATSYFGKLRFLWDEYDTLNTDDFNWDAPLDQWINNCMATAGAANTWWYPAGATGAQRVDNGGGGGGAPGTGVLCQSENGSAFGLCNHKGWFEIDFDHRCFWHY